MSGHSSSAAPNAHRDVFDYSSSIGDATSIADSECVVRKQKHTAQCPRMLQEKSLYDFVLLAMRNEYLSQLLFLLIPRICNGYRRTPTPVRCVIAKAFSASF